MPGHSRPTLDLCSQSVHGWIRATDSNRGLSQPVRPQFGVREGSLRTAFCCKELRFHAEPSPIRGRLCGGPERPADLSLRLSVNLTDARLESLNASTASQI